MHVLDSAWEALKRDFDSTVARRMRSLNEAFRRLRQYEGQEQWLAALSDGVSIGAEKFAVFVLEAGTVKLRGTRGIELREALQFPLSSARTFAAAADGREPLLALPTAAEIGVLAEAAKLGPRVHLFPVTNGERVVAFVLIDAGGPLDTDTVELVANMASAALERQSNQKLQTQIAPATAEPDATPGRPAKLPSWAALAGEARALHSRAQRFARKTVAEIELARPEACRAGREQKNLYLLLQTEIDRARGTYSKQFMKIPSMVDYLHLELIRAAEGDERRLGDDYPGHLV